MINKVKKKSVSLIMIVGILLSYVSGVLPHTRVSAKTHEGPVTEEILNTEDAALQVTYEVYAGEIHWQVDFVKKATDTGVQRIIKLAIGNEGLGLGAMEDIAGSNSEGEWLYKSENFSSQNEQNVIQFKTPIIGYDQGSHFINIGMQMDEKVVEEYVDGVAPNTENLDYEESDSENLLAISEPTYILSENILTENISGPHKVVVRHSLIENVHSENENDVLEDESAEDFEGITPLATTTQFNSANDMLKVGDERDIFLYNAVVTGNHSGDGADFEGAMALFGDSIIPEFNKAGQSAAFNYAAYFSNGSGSGGVGSILSPNHKVALLIGGEILNYGTGLGVISGTKADNAVHPGYVLVNESTAKNTSSWINSAAISSPKPYKLEVQGPAKWIPDSEYTDIQNSLIEQQLTVTSYIEALINNIKSNPIEYGDYLKGWQGVTLKIHQQGNDSRILLVEVPANGNGVAWLPNFHLGDAAVHDTSVEQIIVYSTAKKVVVADTDGQVEADTAGKVTYYLPEATQMTNFFPGFTGDAISVTAPTLPTFNHDATNHYNDSYFKGMNIKSLSTSGFYIAPKATAAFSGGSLNGYLWVENLHQTGGFEVHNFYNPWIIQNVQFSFQLFKHSAEGTNIPIEGAEFIFLKESKHNGMMQYLQSNAPEKWGTNKLTAQKFVTDSDGLITVAGIQENLNYLYYFEETSPADGFEMPEDPIFPAVINTTTMRPDLTNASNQPIEQDFEISFTKLIESTNIALEGAVFGLFNNIADENPAYGLITSNGSGQVKFTNVQPGTYWLIETETLDKFQLADPIQVTLHSDGSVTGLPVNGKFYNSYKDIEIQFNKKNSTGDLLTGAVFELVAEDGTKKYSTENDGVHSIGELEPGIYDLIETQAPNGYQTLGQIGVLSITDDRVIQFIPNDGIANQATIDFTGDVISVTLPSIINVLKEISLEVFKVAIDGNTPLEGAEFTLSKLGESVSTINITGSDGKVAFSNLTPGEYTLKETAPPNGYAGSNSDGWSFIIENDGTITTSDQFIKDGLTISKIVVNELKKFDLTVLKIDDQNNELLGA